MDFLGLRNLDVIEDALDIIERSTASGPDMTTLPLDDAKTYAMLAAGDSVGVFQFESEGMREALKKVAPTSSTTSSRSSRSTARARWTRSPTYARGKRNPERSASSTSACARSRSDEGRDPLPGAGDADRQGAGGFSGAQADDLRKAIGKKNREAMAKLKPEFVEGCRASGTRPSVIERCGRPTRSRPTTRSTSRTPPATR
jgi:DNA polymerase-3 subunit alpha